MNKPLISIIIPTWNNAEYLRPCIVSLLRNCATPGLSEIVVVNNGHPNSCDYLKGQKGVRVINAPSNLMWEGGIDFGLKNTDSPYVVFMNDDTLIPHSSRLWLNQLIQHFRNPQIAAVGPSSNTVMGYQNIFADTPYETFEAKFLIGFCVMMRRSAFEQIGGMDMGLPGGDDLDWSIRLRDAGYKLLVDRSVFVYHHGFKSGERLNGPSSVTNGWNSYEMQEKTNLALIKKHGLAKWWETTKGAWFPPSVSFAQTTEDSEGNAIRKLLKKTDKVVLDIGCGARKTVKKAIGIDFVKRGERIPTLDGYSVSEGDIEADVSKDLPVKEKSADVIIARHVLEHMIDPVKVINNWISKLKKGGILIIAVPNEEWHLTIPMNYEHVHAFTPESIFNLLTAFGLSDIQILNPKNTVSIIAVAKKI